MTNFILKLAMLGILVLLLMQFPPINKFGKELEASVLEKWNNVAAEYNRVKGEVDTTVKTVNDVKDKVVETADNVKKAADSLNNAATAIGKIGATTDAKTDTTATAKP